jgi:laccase
MHYFKGLTVILPNMHAAAWYTGDLKELVDEALITGNDLPQSDAYTINGEPGDFCPCSKGMALINF